MRTHLWIILQMQVAYLLAEHLWTKIMVSQDMIDGPQAASYATVRLEYVTIRKMFCASICESANWCNLWCYDKTNSRCIKSNALVSPLYVSDSPNVYTCYTYQLPDFVVGATATSSDVNRGRVVTNLVRGIYNYDDLMTCCVTAWGWTYNSWILIDLQNVRTIHQIQFTTQPYVYDDDLPSGAEIKIGTTPPTGWGNFGNYQSLGFFPNPSTILTTYTFPIENGAQVRYISVQKYNWFGNFALCRIVAV